ncbi:metallophosphoesterase [Georgenia sp. SYP-B2076]|uniref:metallophosphoesterase family protein n=1 Tax=Georgenia sp. SYP-B2076 TaxID=2495881 RepID=UPI000F8E4242|nr:metallophosphoesterase [Georgenia sp. SYP-B2076]
MSAETRARHRWEWWHRQTTTTRRVLRTVATLLVTGLAALVFGVTTASTHASLGPHVADYHVTLDRQVTIEMGPLGALILDSPLPWPLGVDVVVGEIPSDLEKTVSPAPGLVADLHAYGQLFSEPRAAVADAVRGLVGDALGRTVVAWSVLLVLLAAGRLASHGRLREELKAALARPGVGALGSAATLAMAAVFVVPAMEQDQDPGYSPAVLDGTPLAGARITGRLADLVSIYGGTVKDAYLENEAFYNEASANLAAAFDADPAPRAPEDAAARDAAGDGAAPAPEGAAPAPDGAAPAPDGAAPAPDGAAPAPDGAAPAPSDAPPSPAGAPGPGSTTTSAAPKGEAPDPVTFVLVSDLHCNVGMARVIAAAVHHSGADVLLDAGDTVMSGTSAESYCVDAFAGAVPDGVPVVVSSGNHDSVTTAEQERTVGWTVLSGKVVDVAGISILGDTDPTLTAVGAGTRPERPESIPELGERLAGAACAATDAGARVDLLLVHNPRAGTATMDAGCARLQLSGHWHRTEGPEVLGRGLRYVSTSTGGAAGGGMTLGPLTGAAAITVLRVDRTTGAPMDYRMIDVGTDASVALGPWHTFPEVPQVGGDGAPPVPDGGAASRTATEKPTDVP